ncbi:MAG TPA: cupin domain-containing protein [Vicinamibacterales bacterium]|nr:cupin domain-containing protein [Vicinamibacterales bacterium]
MKRLVIAGFVVSVASQGVLIAQTAGRGAVPATGGRGAKAAPAPVRTTTVRVSVKDPAGASLDGVKITLSGGAEGEFSTAAAGTAVLPNIKDGTYRIRCEFGGFITLEREFQVRGGALTVVDVVLNPAPPPPPPPPRAPEPAPATMAAAGPPVTLSIPDFLEKNFIGRDAIKESILACKPAETVRLLQMRDGVAQHVHDKVDEVIYVVAGDGTIRVGDQSTPIKAGSLAVVPHGAQHALERKGKTPLIVISTLSGTACQPAGQQTQ